jgi:hypothetical protein
MEESTVVKFRLLDHSDRLTIAAKLGLPTGDIGQLSTLVCETILSCARESGKSERFIKLVDKKFAASLGPTDRRYVATARRASSIYAAMIRGQNRRFSGTD